MKRFYIESVYEYKSGVVDREIEAKVDTMEEALAWVEKFAERNEFEVKCDAPTSYDLEIQIIDCNTNAPNLVFFMC